MKEGICTTIGIIGSGIAALFGGFDAALVTLILFMGIDYITGLINEVFSWETPLLLQGVYGGALITTVELLAGLLLNVRLGLNIWDYSSIPCNFMGQICLPFSLLWVILAIVAVVFDDYLRYWLFDEEKPHYRII